MNTIETISHWTKAIAKFIFRRKIIRPVVVIMSILFLVKFCNPHQSYEVVEPETQIHYKLERFGVYARLYISTTYEFGSDYVEFNHTAITFPEFYFVAPDTLIFIDDNGFYIRDVKSDQFVIEQIDRRSSPGIGPDSNHDDYVKMIEADRIRDSINAVLQAKTHYTIKISDRAMGISIYNPQKEEAANKEHPFIFRGG